MEPGTIEKDAKVSGIVLARGIRIISGRGHPTCCVWIVATR